MRYTVKNHENHPARDFEVLLNICSRFILCFPLWEYKDAAIIRRGIMSSSCSFLVLPWAYPGSTETGTAPLQSLRRI